jgi:hypothetical protein
VTNLGFNLLCDGFHGKKCPTKDAADRESLVVCGTFWSTEGANQRLENRKQHEQNKKERDVLK